MPDIPDAVALAQPILYLFIIYTVIIVGIFVALMKWVVDKFIVALDLFGKQIMEKLDCIDDNVNDLRNQGKRKRGW